MLIIRLINICFLIMSPQLGIHIQFFPLVICPPVTESVPSDFTQILNISTIFNIEDCSVSRVIGTLNETTF